MFLTRSAVTGYMPGLEYEAKEMIRDLYIRSKAGALPINPQRFASRVSLNNVLIIAFGFRTESLDDQLVSDALEISREFMYVQSSLESAASQYCTSCRNTTGPVANLVDFIPLLQKLPNHMATRGRALHRRLVDTYGSIVKRIERAIKNGDPYPDCMAKYLLMHREEEELDDLDIIILCCAFMIGGVETVRLSSLVLPMVYGLMH